MSSRKHTKDNSHASTYDKDTRNSIIEEANRKVTDLKTTVSQYKTRIQESQNPQEREALQIKRDAAYEKMEKIISQAKSSVASLTKASNSHYSTSNNVPSKHTPTPARDSTHQSKHDEEHKVSSKTAKATINSVLKFNWSFYLMRHVR